MQLLDVTINKVLKNHLSGIEPLIVTNNEEQLELARVFHEQLANDNDFTVAERYFYQYSGNIEKHANITFSVKCDSKNIYANDMNISFSDKNVLTIRNHGKLFNIRTFNDLFNLKSAFKKEYLLADERYTKITQNEVKRKKIKGIKTKAIFAKIEEIAREEGFEYFIDKEFTNKVKLNIRLTKNDFMELSIPYSNFQDILQNARDTYHSIKKLIDGGIPVKIKYSIYTSDMQWAQMPKEE